MGGDEEGEEMKEEQRGHKMGGGVEGPQDGRR